MNATSLSIDLSTVVPHAGRRRKPGDLELSPFLVAPKLVEGGNQRGGLGKAHQLFGEQLPILLEELNEVLAA